MEIDPARLSARERYRLMIGCIVPRPIALVSTVSHEGKTNVAPFSFFNGLGAEPMTLLFCPANGRDGGEKDTLRNCKPAAEGGTGEFVVNVATEDYIEKVALAAEALPHGESEFDLTEFTPAPSAHVRPPRVEESPVAFECETLQVIRTNPGVPGGGNVVIGRVVHIHLREGLVGAELHVDPAALRAVGRLGGLAYCRTGDRFELPMGRPPEHP